MRTNDYSNFEQHDLPCILDFNETRKILKIGRNSLLMLMQTGILPAFKLQGKWRVRLEDLEEFIEEQI